MADASATRDASPVFLTLGATALPFELRQMPDGRAGWMQGPNAGATNDQRQFRTDGQIAVPKTSGIVFLDGGRVYWDRSARLAHYKPVDDRDFYIGTAVGDAASADAAMTVNLNVAARYNLDLAGMPGTSIPIGTLALGGLGLSRIGGSLNFVLNATSEAQKLDLISKDGFATGAKAIIEIAFNVVNDGSGTVVDVSLGIANATNATDADAITRHLFVHLDANATAIKAQSKDGTTTITATDTTKVYVEGAGNANRVEVWFDLRNPADVQVYVNGVNVLPATVFSLAAAVNTWYLLAHIEKTSSTDTYEFDVDFMRARLQE